MDFLRSTDFKLLTPIQKVIVNFLVNNFC